MTSNHNSCPLFTALGAAAICLSGLFAHSLRPAVADDAAPSPKALYSEKCSACHNLPDPTTEALTAVQWRQTVNRMLYQHGASDSISKTEANTIVTYLATFAAKPAPGGRNQANSTDVFDSNPIYSHVYRFRSTQVAAPFRNISAKYSVYDSAVGPLLAFTTENASAKPAVIEAPTPGLHGDLSEEADFRAAAPGSATVQAKAVSFGLTFDTLDAANYYVARYDDTKKEIDLVQVASGGETLIKSAPVALGLASTPDGWHKLKLTVVEGVAKVWLDYDKAIDVALPGPLIPGGGAGFWTGTKACVRSYTLDIYPVNPLSVAT